MDADHPENGVPIPCRFTLLSFAQFEREVTSERIRDKIAASKRKGLWVGGMVPLGYDTKDRQITVNEAEAESVRTIFQQYLELGSLNLLMADLRRKGIVTKQRTVKTGKVVGGIPFTRGPLAHLLRNRFYIGEVKFKGEILPGEQPAIVERELFEAVQAKLTEQTNSYTVSRTQSEALLMGRLFDDRGNRMGPTHARKGRIKYRYYLSSALIDGRADEVGTVSRVPAAEIETVVAHAVRERLKLAQAIEDKAVVDAHVDRVEVHSQELSIHLARDVADDGDGQKVIERVQVPWRKQASKRRREILLPASQTQADTRPIRSETRATLIAAIARGRRWLNELIGDPQATAETMLSARALAHARST